MLAHSTTSPRFAEAHRAREQTQHDPKTKQTTDEARDYNTRRIKAVQENIAQIEQIIQKKRALRDGTAFVLQQKVQQSGSH